VKGIIIEGVAGTGKTTLIETLKARGSDATFISEEETTGELLTEILEDRLSRAACAERLLSVIRRIQTDDAEFVVLERFHHSYYALGIEWALVEPMDAELAQMDFKTVLLDFDQPQFEQRCLRRPERADDDWFGWFIRRYGSAENAVTAFQQSQRRRHEMLALSRLPSLILNTGEQQWSRYVEEVIRFGGLR
jgi:thymidylate kinase